MNITPLLLLADANETKVLASLAEAAQVMRAAGYSRNYALDVVWTQGRQAINDGIVAGKDGDYLSEIACRTASLATIVKLVYSLSEN